jgi:CheY-like chemotaxis protein
MPKEETAFFGTFWHESSPCGLQSACVPYYVGGLVTEPSLFFYQIHQDVIGMSLATVVTSEKNRAVGRRGMGSRMGKILIVEDDSSLQQCIQLCLKKEGHEPEVTYRIDLAKKKVLSNHYNLIITDYQLAAGQTGIELLMFLKEVCPEIPVILMSGSDNSSLPGLALKLGAYAFLSKPFDIGFLTRTCANALSLTHL